MSKLKQQKIELRRQWRSAQELISNEEKLQKVQTTIANVTKFMKQNPGAKIYMAEAAATLDFNHFLLEKKPDVQTIAKVFSEFGCIIFIDENGNPIDGSKVTTLVVKKTIQEVAPKKGDAISKRDLKRTLEKTLHDLKGVNPGLVDGINKYHQALINNLDNLK